MDVFLYMRFINPIYASISLYLKNNNDKLYVRSIYNSLNGYNIKFYINNLNSNDTNVENKTIINSVLDTFNINKMLKQKYLSNFQSNINKSTNGINFKSLINYDNYNKKTDNLLKDEFNYFKKIGELFIEIYKKQILDSKNKINSYNSIKNNLNLNNDKFKNIFDYNLVKLIPGKNKLVGGSKTNKKKNIKNNKKK
jgi:hypothetical protein